MVDFYVKLFKKVIFGLKVWEVIGIVVGLFIIVIFVLILLCFILCKKVKRFRDNLFVS